MLRNFIFLATSLALTLAFALPTPASAQLNQTIQLPTFAFTTVATTVSVPDQGQALLGGISRSRTGRNQVGTPLLGPGRPFTNVGIGGEMETSTMSINVHIHDFQAMDEALLAQAAANRAARGIAARRQVGENMLGQNPAALSVAEIRRQQSVQQDRISDELADLLARARRAEADGKSNVAKIFYRMIARDATGSLRDEALARIDALSGSTSRIASSP